MSNEFDEDVIEFDHFEPAELVNLLAEGEGTFQIVSVVPTRSKTSGYRMFVVTSEVTDSNGKMLKCDDYLVLTVGDEAGMKRLATRIKNISYAINKPEIYDGGLNKLRTSDFLGGRGKCIIKTQQSNNAQYPEPKSIIAKYIDRRTPAEGQPLSDAAAAPAAAVAQLDDPLPF